MNLAAPPLNLRALKKPRWIDRAVCERDALHPSRERIKSKVSGLENLFPLENLSGNTSKAVTEPLRRADRGISSDECMDVMGSNPGEEGGCLQVRCYP